MVVVSGANRGIGLELVRQLCQRGESVVALCRVASDALKRLDVLVIDGVDVREAESINQAVDKIPHPVHLLINNAGVLFRGGLSDYDVEHIRSQFEVNALGPLLLTTALLPKMSNQSKVVIVTSRMGSITDNDSGGMYGYRMSKAAVNMMGMSLAQDLAPRGISVALLHPGYVRTGMTKGKGFIDPPESARGLLARIDDLTLENTGGFWHANGERLPW